jgi:protein-disulfide isomerase
MSNRQARREQSRSARGERKRAPAARRTSSGGSSGGGGAGDFLSGRFILIAMVLVAVLVIAIGLFATFGGGGGGSSDELVQMLNDAEASFPSDMASGYSLGSSDAPLTITEYEDFQCPHCLNYTGRSEPGIIDQYVKTGQVRLIFQNFPILGVESVAAGKAAECAQQQDMFWPLQQQLFLIQAEAGQDTAEKTNVGRFSDDALRGIAQDVGLDMQKYDACYAADATLSTVQDMAATARSFGLSGTPGFLFNGQPLSSGAPADIDGWKSVIDEALQNLAGATQTPGASETPAAETTATP